MDKARINSKNKKNNTEQYSCQSIGPNIKKARGALKLSQADLCRRCGISTTTMSAYENGRKTPNADTLMRISRALETSIDRLCFGDESEAFLNVAPDVGRKIVNAVYFLWEIDVLIYDPQLDIAPARFGRSGLAPIMVYHYHDQIRRLLISLNEYREKRDTYPDPQAHLESILCSVANEINTVAPTAD